MGMDGSVKFVPADAETLWSLVNSEGSLPEQYVFSISLGLCAALQILYSKTNYVYHGELNPRKLYLTHENEVYLILPSYDVSLGESPFGSEGYSAPEFSSMSFRKDTRADIYGVGAIMWASIAGVEPPFTFPLQDVRTVRPDVSDELADIIKRCCRLPVDDRYQTVDELTAELKSCAVSQGAFPARGLIVLGGR